LLQFGLARSLPLGEHTFVKSTNQKGNVAELAIAKEAARLGIDVLKPLTEHGRYDLALDIQATIVRIQCKWGHHDGDVIRVRISSSYHSPTRGYVKATYDAKEIDAVAVYCESLDRCYLLPISQLAGKSMINLRVGPAQNGQRAALNWASKFEFHGAVAQLEERVAGSDEVRGSSPLSSTHKAADEGRPAEIGAHDFRNQFGYFMERAASGETILIRRRGKLYASLGPPFPPAVT
jgi:hypothetical protein